MQTFLPYADFAKSLQALDYRRLGKQRIEARQLINIIEKLAANPDEKLAWRNHPACLMWRNHVDALKYYYDLSVLTWRARGYNNTMQLMDFSLKTGKTIRVTDLDISTPAAAKSALSGLREEAEHKVYKPAFVGDTEFHTAHQSNLVRKLPEFYQPLFPGIPGDLPYIWPES